MEVLFLGTGTSHGIPVIACSCATCLSENPKNKRLRSSILVGIQGRNFLVDTSIDLRQQCLRYGVAKIDAVLFTHHHVDHIFGLDDTRVFNRIQKKRLPCYGSRQTIDNLKKVYNYIFEYPDIPGGVPMVEFRVIEGPTEIEKIQVQPILIFHGRLPIFAYRIGNFVYATDCSSIPDESWSAFDGVDVLVLDCLRLRPHPTHFHLEESIRTAERIGARTTYFTHMSHEIEHEQISATLPRGMYLAYDGLVLQCQDPS